MLLTVDQILALAPDTSSVSAARKLAQPRHWRSPGRSDTAVWGECQGSVLYRVGADLSDAVPAVTCSCPSRKIPCKHALGLLLMSADDPNAVPAAAAPSWVTEWLETRTRAAARREAVPRKTAPPDPAAQARRAEQRLHRVRQGLEALDLWMHDLIRNGLATADTAGSSVWEAQAARLVDAQASALASRIRGLAFISHATPEWADQLLSELGRVALLTHAFRRIDDLDAPLQADIRQSIGWALKEDEVLASGERVADDWLVLGQWADDDERFRIQRTWLSGGRTGRPAMVLQFAPGLAPFPESFTPGTHFEGELVYWPSAYPLRALVRARIGAPQEWDARLPGVDGFDAFLTFAAGALGRLPWLHRLPCVVRDVVPVPAADAHWSLVDRNGMALPFAGVDKWSVLALSGGHPVDVVAEWDGRTLRPLFAASATERASWSRSQP